MQLIATARPVLAVQWAHRRALSQPLSGRSSIGHFSAPEGLLPGLGHAITRPGHCCQFQQPPSVERGASNQSTGRAGLSYLPGASQAVQLSPFLPPRCLASCSNESFPASLVPRLLHAAGKAGGSRFGAALSFFFHEYGRRVGMVPRSSLKEGKYNQMVEKRTKTTQTKQNQPQPTGRDSTTK